MIVAQIDNRDAHLEVCEEFCIYEEATLRLRNRQVRDGVLMR